MKILGHTVLEWLLIIVIAFIVTAFSGCGTVTEVTSSTAVDTCMGGTWCSE